MKEARWSSLLLLGIQAATGGFSLKPSAKSYAANAGRRSFINSIGSTSVKRIGT